MCNKIYLNDIQIVQDIRIICNAKMKKKIWNSIKSCVLWGCPVFKRFTDQHEIVNCRNIRIKIFEYLAFKISTNRIRIPIFGEKFSNIRSYTDIYESPIFTGKPLNKYFVIVKLSLSLNLLICLYLWEIEIELTL